MGVEVIGVPAKAVGSTRMSLHYFLGSKTNGGPRLLHDSSTVCSDVGKYNGCKCSQPFAAKGFAFSRLHLRD